MNQLFHKTAVLFLFFTSVFFILITGISLLSKQAIQADDASMIKIAFSSVTLLMLINIYDIISFWIYGKRREFFVKKLAGTTPAQQIRTSLVNFLLIVGLSFVIGFGLASAVSAITKIIGISVAATIKALLSGMALSLAFGWPMLTQRVQAIYRGQRL
jgi:hypothetical protein